MGSAASRSHSTAPLASAGGRRSIPVWAWLLPSLALVLIGLATLRSIEPSGQSFYPRCWLYQTTGLQCPGCGTTRAVHALLNGRVAEAFRLNALVFLAAPLVGWLGVRWLWAWRTGRRWPNPLTSPFVLALLAGVAVGYGVGRNVGWNPGSPSGGVQISSPQK